MRCEGASGSAVSHALVEWCGLRGIHSGPFHNGGRDTLNGAGGNDALFGGDGDYFGKRKITAPLLFLTTKIQAGSVPNCSRYVFAGLAYADSAKDTPRIAA
jgi:hypothetical protein